MRKTSFEYHIHGYRYAPESFRIYKGLPGQKKTEIPLSDEQRYQVGYLCLTQDIKSAVDYVKHIERERERKCRQYMTYGFLLKENPHRLCTVRICDAGKATRWRCVWIPCVRSGNIWPSTEAVLNRVWNANWMGITAPSKYGRIMKLPI